MPALLTRMSSGPCSLSTEATSGAIAARSRRSHTAEAAAPMAPCARSSFPRSPPTMITLAPADASPSAMARPRPEPPPVTRAVLPVRSKDGPGIGISLARGTRDRTPCTSRAGIVERARSCRASPPGLIETAQTTGSAAMSLAVVIHAPRDLRVEEDAVPVLGPKDVEVRIGAGGICGSDLHYYQDGGFGTVRIKEPMVLGHEIAGVVTAIGEAVASVRAGDKVAVNPSRPCG